MIESRYEQRSLTKAWRAGLLLFGCCAALWVIAMTARAQQQAPGADTATIRVWGHGHRGQDYIQTLMTAWQEGFRKTHPEARFDDELDGDASAIGALFTGAADLAILDREASFTEVDAYQQGTGYDPFRIPEARGSVALRHHAPALMVYVNAANPLSHLTVQQLDGIFDADHRTSARSYRTWGDLGLTGEWADQPIQMYTYFIQSAEVQFFERAAMKGSQKFSCCITTFEPKLGVSAEQQIANAVKRDKFGLGLSTLPAPGLKAIALATGEDAPPVLPTAESITSETYPLARIVYVYVNRKPKASVPAKLAAFLEYIVSPEGQAIVARTGGYLPLSPEEAAQAREALR
jgi:phosphate transport system substrate-binding protein